MKNDPRVSRTFNLHPMTLAKLKKAADERCVSANLIVDKAINDFLDRLISVDEMIKT